MKGHTRRTLARHGYDVTLVNRRLDETTTDEYGDDEVVDDEYVVKAIVDLAALQNSLRDEGGTFADYEATVHIHEDERGTNDLASRGDETPPSLIVRESGKTYRVMSFDEVENGIVRLGCVTQQETTPEGVRVPSDIPDKRAFADALDLTLTTPTPEVNNV